MGFMEKRHILGRKNQFGRDLPVLIRTDGWEMPTVDDILGLIDDILKNDARIYPREKGFFGVNIFISQLLDRVSKHLVMKTSI